MEQIDLNRFTNQYEDLSLVLSYNLLIQVTLKWVKKLIKKPLINSLFTFDYKVTCHVKSFINDYLFLVRNISLMAKSANLI